MHAVPGHIAGLNAAFNTGWVAACTVLTCSCTAARGAWSSSTVARDPPFAWLLVFFDGSVFVNFKGNSRRVRAVRGGL